MRIVVDENIPFALDAFGPLGEVVRVAGRSLAPEAVRDADALIVRSVTKVGPALLEGSRVRFVGTATIGVEHVDVAWLAERGIAFASAQGSNAESVAQWVAGALCALTRRMSAAGSAETPRPLAGITLGVAGVGHCGSRVARIAEALGMRLMLCDPPLARARQNPGVTYHPLAALAECDIITLHTPLTRSGPDATLGLISADFLNAMRPGSALINACRGGVVDEAALKAALRSGRLAAAAIDTWAGEPRIDPELALMVEVASPHVAGYSFEGKARGTEMISHALCRFLGREPVWSAAEALGGVADTVRISTEAPEPGAPGWDAFVRDLIEPRVPLARDTAAIRELAALGDPDARAREFDRLRRDYPVRREFSATVIQSSHADMAGLRALSAIGFKNQRPKPLSH